MRVGGGQGQPVDRLELVDLGEDRRPEGRLALEGIVLHAFEGTAPFSEPVLAKIEQLKAVYGLTLTAADAHKLEERP